MNCRGSRPSRTVGAMSPQRSGPGGTPVPPGQNLSHVSQTVRALLDAAPSAVVILDAAGRIDYGNALVRGTFGYEPDEIVGEPLDILVLDRPGELDEWHRPQPGSVPQHEATETRRTRVGRRRDGTEFPVEVRSTPITMEDGEARGVVSLTDISSQQADESRLRRLTRAYLFLAQLNKATVRAQDARALYADICRIAVDTGGYLAAWVGERSQGSSVRTVATAGILDAYIAQLEVTLDADRARGCGPTAVTLREDRSCYSTEFSTDAATKPWHELASAHGIQAAATLPLHEAGETVAVLTLYTGQSKVFDQERRDLLEQTAQNVSFALTGFRAEGRVRRSAAQRSELLRRLVVAQESERARIAADVHDDSVQALAVVDLRLGLLQRRLQQVAPDLVSGLDPIKSALASATAGLRQLLFELEPLGSAASCATAVREIAGFVFETSPTNWTVHCDGDLHLPDVEQGQALRIIKEALINVRKHAHADTVTVTVCNAHLGVEGAVTDDGVGLGRGDRAPTPGHRGLQTMTDRAEVAGGWCRFEQAPTGGTTVRFWIPRSSSAVPPLS